MLPERGLGSPERGRLPGARRAENAGEGWEEVGVVAAEVAVEAGVGVDAEQGADDFDGEMPRASDALVPRAKVAGYLLALHHPIGGSKARFFHQHGFRAAEPERLAQALLSLALAPVQSRRITPYGTKYVIRGEIPTPRTATVWIETVWMCSPPDFRPRLVTAYPARPPAP